MRLKNIYGGKIMKKVSLSLFSLMVALGMAIPANATTINLSLDIDDWGKTPYLTSAGWQTPNATVTNTAEGYLHGTKTTATGGTNWSLGIHTNDSYNFQDSILRYQWKLNGQGSYSGIYTGVDLNSGHLINNFDPNPPYTGGMTTAWSWAGSEVIPNNAWLWTEIIFSETGYDFAVSKTGYGDTDFLHGTKAIGASTWDALADARLFFQIGDNYVAGAYFDVAGASITTPDAPVPEPATMLLMGTGLAGLAAARRKKKA